VLILDEATSALDALNEAAILATIGSLRGRLTIVLITHRIAATRNADLVYVLDAGRLVEQGGWADLAARPDGTFRALVDAQRMDPTPVSNETPDVRQAATRYHW
jgi:ABC-type multidrug transport system fused ATPase/permease subunit